MGEDNEAKKKEERILSLKELNVFQLRHPSVHSVFLSLSLCPNTLLFMLIGQQFLGNASWSREFRVTGGRCLASYFFNYM